MPTFFIAGLLAIAFFLGRASVTWWAASATAATPAVAGPAASRELAERDEITTHHRRLSGGPDA